MPPSKESEENLGFCKKHCHSCGVNPASAAALTFCGLLFLALFVPIIIFYRSREHVFDFSTILPGVGKILSVALLTLLFAVVWLYTLSKSPYLFLLASCISLIGGCLFHAFYSIVVPLRINLIDFISALVMITLAVALSIFLWLYIDALENIANRIHQSAHVWYTHRSLFSILFSLQGAQIVYFGLWVHSLLCLISLSEYEIPHTLHRMGSIVRSHTYLVVVLYFFGLFFTANLLRNMTKYVTSVAVLEDEDSNDKLRREQEGSPSLKAPLVFVEDSASLWTILIDALNQNLHSFAFSSFFFSLFHRLCCFTQILSRTYTCCDTACQVTGCVTLAGTPVTMYFDRVVLSQMARKRGSSYWEAVFSLTTMKGIRRVLAIDFMISAMFFLSNALWALLIALCAYFTYGSGILSIISFFISHSILWLFSDMVIVGVDTVLLNGPKHVPSDDSADGEPE